MWLLSFIPDFVYHLLLLASIVAFGSCYILKMVPFISANVEIIRVISVVVMIFSVWMEGGIANESKWKARVAELEIKVAKAEKVAAEANSKIETVYVDRVKVVKEVQYVVQNSITKNADKLDLTCKVDPLTIDILNQAALMGTKK
jgi:uncharacterized coiled-coil protein SlyX